MTPGVGPGQRRLRGRDGLAVQFAQHLPQRRMMVLYAAVLVMRLDPDRAATGPAMFITGTSAAGYARPVFGSRRAAAGTSASGLDRLRETADDHEPVIVGASRSAHAGRLQASADAWRPLFWIVATISLTAFELSILTFEDTSPPMVIAALHGPAT